MGLDTLLEALGPEIDDVEEGRLIQYAFQCHSSVNPSLNSAVELRHCGVP